MNDGFLQQLGEEPTPIAPSLADFLHMVVSRDPRLARLL
jgi:hypothetical protein